MLEQYKHIFCDLDGCIVSGQHLLPGAKALLATAGARLIVLSNNSTDTPASLTARLNQMGFGIERNQIVLAGVTAVELLAAEESVESLHLFGTPEIQNFARSLGLNLTTGPASDILLTRDVSFSYPHLQALLRQARQGARLTVANMDITHPGIDGVPVPETGALLAAVTACLPELEFRAVGKPEPFLFERALTKAGGEPADAVMIGDNPVTDGAGARRAGIAHVLIGDAPDAIAPDLAALLALN